MRASSKTPTLDPRAPLVLDTSELSRRPGAMRHVSLTVPPPPGLGVAMVRMRDGADLDLDLRLESVQEGVLVSGTVRGAYVGECSAGDLGVLSAMGPGFSAEHVYFRC